MRVRTGYADGNHWMEPVAPDDPEDWGYIIEITDQEWTDYNSFLDLAWKWQQFIVTRENALDQTRTTD